MNPVSAVLDFLLAVRARNRAVKLIRESRLFDSSWYRERYPDVAAGRLEPIRHYVKYGADERRDPHPLFSTSFYLSRNLDVARSGINPLLHYYLYGAAEGRDPNPLFDTDWYLRQNPDVAASGVNPLVHYLFEGAKRGANPNPHFDSAWYLQANPNVAEEGWNPLVHFIAKGAAQGRKPHPGAGAAHHPNRESERAPPSWSRQEIIEKIDEFARARPGPFYPALRQIAEQSDELHLSSIVETLSADGAVSMAAGPLVSVVMPVYNRAGLVEHAIHSVLAQSYSNFELIVCDDGSTDGSADAVAAIPDQRITLIRFAQNAGAAAARNRCLEAAKGEYVAYLDSDNLWNPHFLARMVAALRNAPGQPLAYASYFDVEVDGERYTLLPVRYRSFDYDLQITSPYIDLNSIVHHIALYRTAGGFDESLRRLQDYDLVAKYAWFRDPQHVPLALNIYRRFKSHARISAASAGSDETDAKIKAKISRYYRDGLPVRAPDWVKKVSVLSWDMSRNHFAKAYSVAEALSSSYEVKLISFQFFEDQIFRPLAGSAPAFQMKAFPGGRFPDFAKIFEEAVAEIDGDVIYAVKPRLTSFGLALLASCRRQTPILLEANDLETVVSDYGAMAEHRTANIDEVLALGREALSPFSDVWSRYLDPLAARMPLLFTHNENLNRHYGSKCLYMRNIKNEAVYDPSRYDRAALRRAFGLGDGDRMILFGGLVRSHKGIQELLQFLKRPNSARYRLFVAGSVETPDLEQLKREASESIVVLPPQPPERMAALNYAADAVILWLNPNTPISHYQMPYKFTDAIAMGTPVIASPVSDLAHMSGIVWHVPYGDYDALEATLNRIVSDGDARRRRGEAGRRLFEKEFTYRAVRQNFALGCAIVGTNDKSTRAVSRIFAEEFTTLLDSLHF